MEEINQFFGGFLGLNLDHLPRITGRRAFQLHKFHLRGELVRTESSDLH